MELKLCIQELCKKKKKTLYSTIMELKLSINSLASFSSFSL